MQGGLESISKDQESKHWLFKPGHNAPGPGRPKGSRNKLGEAFIDALHKDFQEHGPVVIERVRQEKPEQYLKVIAMIVPKELHVRDTSFDNLTDEDLADIIASVRASRAKIIEASAAETCQERSDSVHGDDVPEVRDGSLPSSDS